MPIINNLDGNEIEILKLADFLTGVEHDITDVYFGELQIFTVWAESEGTLPITINTNGESLVAYKLYGNMTQNGIPTPDNPIYPSECGEKTANLFDLSSAQEGYGIDASGNVVSQAGRITTTPIDVSDLSTVFITWVASSDSIRYIYATFSNGALVERVANKYANTTIDVSSADQLYICLYSSTAISKSDFTSIMLNSGSTSLLYEPSGYRINVVVSSENLWDYNLHESAGLWDNNGQFVENSAYIILQKPIEIDPNYSYTYGMESGYSRGTYFSYAWFDANGDIISSKRKTISVEIGNRYTETFTPPANARYINIATYMHNSNRMFVKGSTEPASYVPYSVTNMPIYLSEVSSERYVKKYEFTGQEKWYYSSGAFYTNIVDLDSKGLRQTTFNCSHYELLDDGRDFADVTNNSIYTGAGGPNGTYVYIFTDTYTNTTNFKSYLAQQLANGTPVTIWYPLRDPSTDIINEPLRKIGSYVDSISGTGLPTLDGSTVYDVNLTAKPSKIYVKYRKRET